MIARELSPRQKDVLAFVNRFRAVEQCNPTCGEIAANFGWASENAAHGHLVSLERKGAIRYRDGSRARGYRVSRGFESYLGDFAEAAP